MACGSSRIPCSNGLYKHCSSSFIQAFEPALNCARKIIAANGMSGKIALIQKRSTEVKVPEDMPTKANILITEVFDTELIGEGAIGTFRHALEHLLVVSGC